MPIPTKPPAAAESGAATAGPQVKLRLYVAGATPLSARAIVNTRGFCEQFLKGRYELEVLTISGNNARAAEDQIIAAPTLVKLEPVPVRRYIGDLSRTARLLADLGLKVGDPP